MPQFAERLRKPPGIISAITIGLLFLSFNLGFGVLAGQTVTNTVTSTIITGNVGVFQPTVESTNFSPKASLSVQLDPNYALAWYNLGYASRKSQQFPRSAEAYRKCIALAPDEMDAYYGLAESLRQGGKSDDPGLLEHR